MDFGSGGSDGGSGEGASGSGGIKRKWDDFETSMKAMKDALVKDNEEKSAKIRKLMEENVGLKQRNVKLEEAVLPLENLSFQEPGVVRPLVAPDLFDVFPPEVWKAIIEKIPRFSDMEMFCLAFPQLEQMVKNLNKTVFLFEKVIPLINKKLDLNDILNCRLVCDKWNQDLCTLLENSQASSHSDLTTSKSPFSFQYLGPSSEYFNAYSFDNSTKIKKFLQKMSDHPGNPFFGRFLRFHVVSRTDLNNFFKSALVLVEQFGEYVHSLGVELYFRRSYNLIKFYKAVQKILAHLPNLKDLTIKYFNYAHDNNGTSETIFSIAAPLPPLPYLESLKLDLNSEMGMVNAFTPYFSNQIHHLRLLRQMLGDVSKAESFRELINLQYLEVELRSKQDILRLLEFPTANLKKLSLHSPRSPAFLGLDSLSSMQFLNLSEKFSRLERLNLISCHKELSSFLGSRIQFSGLKTLEIAVGIREDDIQNNLDFMLRLSTLKHLVICFDGRTGIEETDKHSALKIRKYLNEGHMLKSNIWTLMPSIELLETRGSFRTVGGIFTREMFENRVG